MLVLCHNHPVSSRLLAVLAHPDDESFGVAGTAMRLIDAGHEAALLTLTRGDAGLWFGKERGSWTREELAAERAKEWQGAVTTIGFQRSWLLRWPDGGLAASDPDAVTRDIARVIRDFRPDTVVTFGPEGAGSEHDDHAATSRLCTRAFRWAGEPDVAEDLGAPHRARRLFFTTAPEGTGGLRGRKPAGFLSSTHVVDISAYAERKGQAFENHRTQFKDRDFFYEVLRRRGGKEHFHLAVDREGTPREDSLV